MNKQKSVDQVLKRNKKNVKDFYFQALHEMEFEKGIEKYTGKVYRQHNPNVPDDKEGFIRHFEETKSEYPDGGSNVLRTVAEGDYVGVHVHHVLKPEPQYVGMASLDIFKLDEKGKLVEHWDAMQYVPNKTMSGHTLFDGPIKIENREMTETNKKMVKSFVELVLIGGNLDRLFNFFNGDTYIQHNPKIPDSVSGWLKAVEKMKKQGKPLIYQKLHNIIAEGSFILTQSEGEYNGIKTVIMDLYRVENNKIAEHWDSIWERLPEKIAHENSLF